MLSAVIGCWRPITFAACFSGALAACVALPREPVSEMEQQHAEVPDMPGVRDWADAPQRLIMEDAHAASRAAAASPDGFVYLALSGGAEYGAYGAGVLAGWSAAGTRPEFTIVSGVSTGALMAPFAFLGSTYDPLLREAYTGGAASKVLSAGGPLTGLFGSGFYDTKPLERLVARFVDETMLAAVAAEHARGRRLYVVTTNLDAQRPVLWDMGAIATSGHRRSLDLFRDVLVASASVPGLFRPMPIEAEAAGRRFREMHVDGGVTAQYFLAPPALLSGALPIRDPAGAKRTRIYVIVNNQIEPEFDLVPARTLRVATRAVETSIKAQGVSLLNATEQFADHHGIPLNIAFIDVHFDDAIPRFDPALMLYLYEKGYREAASNRAWRASPPEPVERTR
jgi:hypothetical protein